MASSNVDHASGPGGRASRRRLGWPAAFAGTALVVLLAGGLQQRTGSVLSQDVCEFPGSDAARIEAFLEAGCYKGWPHDSEVRRTGPIIGGVDFFTHGRARVYYSPEVFAWLLAGRPDVSLPEGAMIVKENWPPLPEDDPPDPSTLFWTTMIRVPSGAWDGWFWQASKPGPDGWSAAQFGNSSCLSCHASADNRNLSFSSLRNVFGEPDRYDTPDPTWDYYLQHSLAATTVSPIHSQVFDPPPIVPLAQPLADPDGRFLQLFDQISLKRRDQLRSFPSTTVDPVVSSAQGPSRFLTSSQCVGCHNAVEHLDNVIPPMISIDSQGRRVNLSPYGEWSASMMGLSGRDPVFHAQIESEKAMRPAMAGFIDNTCFRCHGAMGQRQLHLDRGEPFGHDMLYATTGSYATYGALARDGVSCTVCHSIAADGLGQPSTFTGLFNTEPADQVIGPYDDPKTYSMLQALGITPRGAEHIKSSALCGSCHTVILPQVPSPFRGSDPTTDPSIGFEHEQTTYLEWLNSAYQDERQPWNAATAKSCQACHMPSTYQGRELAFRIASIQDQTYPPVDTIASEEEIGLIDRIPFARHVLVGLNLFVMQMFQQFSSLLGVPESDGLVPPDTENAMITAQQSVMELAREQTARVEITSVERASEHMEVGLRVTNLVGHKFPSGVGFRRAFIEFSVLDAQGQVLWGSGRVSPLGVILDHNGLPLETEFSKRTWQLHHEVVERQDQVQIYEERHLDDRGELTTSFFGLFRKVKDNRLTPLGWNPNGPDIKEMRPVGAGNDPRYHDGSGLDDLLYRVPLRAILDAASVEARLHYQSIPPYYLRDRFERAPNGVETQRLHFIASRLNTEGTPIHNWRLEVASASRVLTP